MKYGSAERVSLKHVLVHECRIFTKLDRKKEGLKNTELALKSEKIHNQAEKSVNPSRRGNRALRERREPGQQTFNFTGAKARRIHHQGAGKSFSVHLAPLCLGTTFTPSQVQPAKPFQGLAPAA